LGYLEPGKFENMSESERHTVLDCRFEANALIEQGFEPASDGLVLGNGLGSRNATGRISWEQTPERIVAVCGKRPECPLASPNSE
jgi:hypothetical protein